MVKSILGRKLRMTQMFTKDGKQIPLTAIAVGPCPIVQIKTPAKDGYAALQIGYGEAKAQNLTRPMAGHFANAGVKPLRVLREIRVESAEGFTVGQTLDSTLFQEGDRVDVTGVSKGRGFQGGIRRHNWRGGRMSHGSMFHRAIGSNSPGSGQSRLFKGKTLPGHMGHERVTLQNLEIVKVDTQNHILYVRGGVPGPDGGLVFVKGTAKTNRKKAVAK
ncbi:MAG TPA: 50S ribosomal protein L3 [bacterium]|nr:50S ribosomal protein L3 [Candidatus Omnitrophota bacterium]HOJ60510.1 50S ribosomal protein L3 [bacterium]HOL96224.1 50S ribosomal protein L3 [bacterium]HPP02507.1 50S ribosomal protein L3 [bacterium]